MTPVSSGVIPARWRSAAFLRTASKIYGKSDPAQHQHPDAKCPACRSAGAKRRHRDHDRNDDERKATHAVYDVKHTLSTTALIRHGPECIPAERPCVIPEHWRRGVFSLRLCPRLLRSDPSSAGFGSDLAFRLWSVASSLATSLAGHRALSRRLSSARYASLWRVGSLTDSSGSRFARQAGRTGVIPEHWRSRRSDVLRE